MNCNTERDKFRCTRFINIFNSKDEAIRKLDNTSRYYGEPVMIRYRDENGYTRVMLALYKSEAKGDYEIGYDPDSRVSNERIHNILKEEGESDEDALSRCYIGKPGPFNGDLVIVSSPNLNNVVYIYLNDTWLNFSQNLTLRTSTKISDSISIDLSLDESLGIYTIGGNVKVDGKSIVSSPTGKLSVNIIDGGNLKDL